MSQPMDRIVPLSDLEDYEVAEGEPDVRGWDVLSADGDTIGQVDQLLIDTSAMKVRYLDVDVNEELLGAEDNRHILVPIGYARLDEDEDHVIVDRLRTSEVRNVPEYRPGPLTPEHEAEVRESFEAGFGGPGPTEEGFYEGEAFEEERFRRGRGAEAELGEEQERRVTRSEEELGEEQERRVTRSEEELRVGKREIEAGQVDIEKRIETEHVREPVELTHEEVDIQRRPVTGMRAGEARFEEEDIRIPLSEEEAVVEKRPMMREELIVRKRPVTETEQVEADVRREELDIEERGRVRESREGAEERRRRGR